MAKEVKLRRLAWTCWLVTVALCLGVFLMIVTTFSLPFNGWGFRGFPSVVTIPFALMGMLILRRYPLHGVGWTLLGVGIASAIQGLLFEYAIFGLLIFPGRLPGTMLIAWFLNSYWMILIFLLGLLLLLFPEGELPSRRWRVWILALLIFNGVIFLFSNLSSPRLDSSFANLENPYLFGPLQAHYYLLGPLYGMLMLAELGAPAVNLARRFRRSRGFRRQQFKWFVFAGALVAVAGLFAGPSNRIIVQYVLIIAILFLPVAIAASILRYRLYDIDILIRRTLLYGILTGTLLFIYFVTIVLLQNIFLTFSGQSSPIAIVISTLFIAGLFAPLRRRIQDAIAHRFYRQKYDAQLLLQRFSTTVRDKTDIEQLTAELANVVDEAIQPQLLGIWLRESDHDL